jgi:ketosteroid isomerase-like protein
MGEQQNVEIVKRAYEAFGKGDLETLVSLLDDGIEWQTPGPASLPTAGRRRGTEQVREFFRAINETYEIQRFEPRTFLTQGNLVVVLGEDTARIKATDKVVVEPWVHVFAFENGRVVRFQEYLDTASTIVELQAAQAKV